MVVVQAIKCMYCPCRMPFENLLHYLIVLHLSGSSVIVDVFTADFDSPGRCWPANIL